MIKTNTTNYATKMQHLQHRQFEKCNEIYRRRLVSKLQEPEWFSITCELLGLRTGSLFAGVTTLELGDVEDVDVGVSTT